MGKGVAFQLFTEAEIHKSLKKKIPGSIIKKRVGDPIISMEIFGVPVKNIRIPGHHTKVYFNHKQSKRIADDLQITPEEYNNLIKCPYKKVPFIEFLEKQFVDLL